jgi:CheY-like chemotaxis protein/two-component sensor histidine kinase
VDDLLDVSRITRGMVVLRREPVELAEIVARALETVRPLMDARGHTVEMEVAGGPLLLDADPTRLAQVVANLLNNAAKYTDPGGHIVLRAGRESDEAVVRIRDTGAGIPAEMLSRVFELFSQAERTLDRSQGGLGVGLTLVKRLVEQHGGRVEALSDGPGKGSEFIVRLPIPGQLPAPRSRPTSEPTAAVEPKRILVVDDNIDAADTLAELLKVRGHDVRVARDGPSALEAARELRPGVVFLDIGLPGMNGFLVAQALRQDVVNGPLRIIALTGYGQDEDRRRSAEAGFDDHLVKPVPPEVLLRLLADEPRQPLPAG